MTNKLKILFLTVILSASIIAPALCAPTPIKFKISPAESHITFKATQGGSAIKGEFKNFTADINFHPEALATSKVKVTINMGSYIVDDKEASNALQDKEWFSTALFPQAIFESKSFKSLGNNIYEATGSLTIKGIAKDITLSFTLNKFSETAAFVTGEALLKRREFNVGEESTDSVADDVRVAISLNAVAGK